MGKIKEFWRGFREGSEGRSGREKLLLLVLTGLLLLVIVWPVGDGKTDTTAQTAAASAGQETETLDYAAQMEQRLTDILEQVEGAGEVRVMITLKGSSEQIVEKDESYSENKSSQTGDENSTASADSISRSEATVYDSASGGSPYVVKELQPEVEGILVVAAGAGDRQVVNEITYAVQVLFDVPVHKIKVVKMSSQ